MSAIIGGSRNITPVGPGYYSFNWWLNGTNRLGQRLYVEAPADLYVASKHGASAACGSFRASIWWFCGTTRGWRITIKVRATPARAAIKGSCARRW
jgi:hypothetical protein